MENTTISSVPSVGSRLVVRMDLQQAVARMPRTSSVETTSSGGTRACFRPSVVAKPVAVAVTKVRKHRYPTEERVTRLLADSVKYNLDHGMGRSQALESARDRILNLVIATNMDLTDEDRTARTDQVKNLDVIAFWSAYGPKPETKAEPKALPATPVVHTSESLLAALAGADQVTSGDAIYVTPCDDSLAIPEEPEIPVMQRPAVRSKTVKVTPSREQGLTRLPLTTPGHLGDVAALFIDRNLAEGMSEEEALRKACNKLFYVIESDTTLSQEDAESLKSRVRAKLPKRGPKPLTDKGRVEELLLRFAIEATNKGFNRPEAAGEATDRVLAIVHREVAVAEHESVFTCVKNWLQTSFTQPLVESGASLEEIEEAVQLSQEIFAVSHEEHFAAPKPRRHNGPRHTTHRQPTPMSHQAPTTAENAVETKPVTPGNDADRAAEKKAARKARAEASAQKSRDLHACAQSAAATTKPKKEKKGKKGAQQVDAQAE